jgi:CDGSH-type Zn-finger protein/uncharacterized Fe-S cluster protein YjdI
MSKTKEYRSDAIVVTFEPRRCIHAEECIHGLPGVFEKDRRPWIDPNEGEPQVIADVVHRCPTGALGYERLDGGPAEAPAGENSAFPAPDGPLYVAGDLLIRSSEGESAETRVALCRCGASRHKPYCDSSHLECGFADPGELGDGRLVPPEEGAEVGGRVEISTAPNGPLIVRGPLTVRSADGSSECSGTKGSLCRCGASEKKPYCDGRHKEIGFEAE